MRYNHLEAITSRDVELSNDQEGLVGLAVGLADLSVLHAASAGTSASGGRQTDLLAATIVVETRVRGVGKSLFVDRQCL